jgi:hypothetical protein
VSYAKISGDLPFERLHLRSEDEPLFLADLMDDLQYVRFELLILESEIQEGNSHRRGL